MVNIGVSDKCFLFNTVKRRYQLTKNAVHLLFAVCVTCINKKAVASAFDYRRIAPARGFYQNNFGLFRYAVGRNAGREILSSGFGEQFAKAGNAVKGAIRRNARFIEPLHCKVGVDQKRLSRIGGNVHHR